MLKKIIYISFILYLLPLINNGQDIRNKTTGFEVSLSYNYLEEFKAHFLFNITKRKHEFFIGPEFPFTGNCCSLFGMDLGYKFYPNKSKSVFDLFFQYRLQAIYRKLYSRSTEKGFSVHNTLGYGFNVFLSNKLFLTHSFGLGIEKSWFRKSGNFTDFSLFIKLGVGININFSKD